MIRAEMLLLDLQRPLQHLLVLLRLAKGVVSLPQVRERNCHFDMVPTEVLLLDLQRP
eukprot:CAMPEP_0198498110 /NCGR_PEP_ID=MMETSP1462-20131121/6804_1 /TAXON_ID=1333877 /ORGANISM="Brandtodinium nutriculum, Strain RCC3387" /LENGTH=56 /DNA_ID=CAMNT_0044227007 /DNA_START=107 /DNA_END=274 /DNA_ORIENTATION=-